MQRAIDVIFKQPVKKFTVIYQQGKFWQLPRLEFDGHSLRYKRLYTGSRTQIFVAQDQRLPADDLLLCSQLATLTLPATVAGKNADEFERWWQQNSYNYHELNEIAKQQQAHAKALLANPNAQILNTLRSVTPKIDNSVSAQPIVASMTRPQASDDVEPLKATPIVSQSQSVSTVPDTSGPDLTAFDDIFSHMMADLTQHL